VPHSAPSQSTSAVPSADPLCDASGRERSYLNSLCTITAPTMSFPFWLWLARDCSSALLAKTRNATPTPISLVALDLNARLMDTLLAPIFFSYRSELHRFIQGDPRLEIQAALARIRRHGGAVSRDRLPVIDPLTANAVGSLDQFGAGALPVLDHNDDPSVEFPLRVIHIR